MNVETLKWGDNQVGYVKECSWSEFIMLIVSQIFQYEDMIVLLPAPQVNFLVKAISDKMEDSHIEVTDEDFAPDGNTAFVYVDFFRDRVDSKQTLSISYEPLYAPDNKGFYMYGNKILLVSDKVSEVVINGLLLLDSNVMLYELCPERGREIKN